MYTRAAEIMLKPFRIHNQHAMGMFMYTTTVYGRDFSFTHHAVKFYSTQNRHNVNRNIQNIFNVMYIPADDASNTPVGEIFWELYFGRTSVVA